MSGKASEPVLNAPSLLERTRVIMGAFCSRLFFCSCAYPVVRSPEKVRKQICSAQHQGNVLMLRLIFEAPDEGALQG